MSLDLQTQRMQARVENGVGWMIFNNPARHNALSLEMWQGIGDILESYASDDSVRVVVMRGAGGKAFVSGADISEFDEKRSNAEQQASYGKIAGRATRWLNKLEKPLIALIEGARKLDRGFMSGDSGMSDFLPVSLNSTGGFTEITLEPGR